MTTVKTSDFFICTYAYEKRQEDGNVKRVKEQYVVDALSFTEDEEADTYYKLKANFISLDEKTGKEKKESHCYLVQGTSTQNAQHNFDAEMKKTMIDYSVGAIIETKIMDIFMH